MLKYTKATLNKIVSDFKRYYRIFKNASLIFTSAYFIYALINKTGNFYANIVLAILFVTYTIFEIATRDKNMKTARKNVKKGYKWTKIAIKALTLGAMLYGIYTATTRVTPLSIILATLMIILWILQFLLAIVIEVVENKINLFVIAIKEDFKKPRIFGKRDEGEDKPREIIILDEQIEKEEAEKAKKKQHQREEKREARREKRAQRKERRAKKHTLLTQNEQI